MRLPSLALLLLFSAGASAQELSLLGGELEDRPGGDGSYSWELEYLVGYGEHVALCFCWINEGHLPGNHRDGPSAQVWVRTSMFEDRLSLLAGVGTYRFFDTAASAGIEGSEDVHGFGYVASLGARWYSSGPWLYQARVNLIETADNLDTISFLVGVGYQLERSARVGPWAGASGQPAEASGRQLTVSAGQTIVNTFQSQKALATSLEYRQGLTKSLEWSVSWLHEADDRLVRRNGMASQLWLVRDFLQSRLSLGAGGGFYYSVDDYRESQPGGTKAGPLAGLFTMMASYRVTPRLSARLSWNRLVSDYNEDADIVLLGVSRNF